MVILKKNDFVCVFETGEHRISFLAVVKSKSVNFKSSNTFKRNPNLLVKFCTSTLIPTPQVHSKLLLCLFSGNLTLEARLKH